jgi:ABC-type taurine transport system ATPase subunit
MSIPELLPVFRHREIQVLLICIVLDLQVNIDQLLVLIHYQMKLGRRAVKDLASDLGQRFLAASKMRAIA